MTFETMNEQRDYPIGIQSFSEIRNGNYLYIDKTEYVRSLVKTGKYYFLSRPRRFGKSLLISTLEAYFLGKRELFKGLAIDSYVDLDWREHPVLHLDLNAKTYSEDNSSLFNVLDNHLKIWEAEYGVTPSIKDVDIRFYNVVIAAFKKTGCQVVILVDEYDRPILQNLHNERRQDFFRNTLKGFFGVLKSCDDYIKFAFLTGITKFSKVSVFSDLNNLNDITLDTEYNAVCGISESELLADLRPDIGELAHSNGLSFDETCRELKTNYDGYRFGRRATEGIYNPFSLLNVLMKKDFSDYWFQTGTPTMLINLLKKHHVDIDRLDGAHRTDTQLLGIDPTMRDPVPVLFQSGYLTIKEAIRRGVRYTFRLGFPNREVESGFLNELLPYYVNRNVQSGDLDIYRFINALEEKDVDGFINMLKSLLAGVPFDESGHEHVHENRFRDVMFIICRLIGLNVFCEYHIYTGRIDMTVKTERYIYIMEFKIDKPVKDALAQIHEKGYADPFRADGRKIILVGVSFSSEARNIVDFSEEDI
jgi:hypothetical protein